MNYQPPSVLIVDDEVDICDNYSDILTELGYQVQVAHDGLAALLLIQDREFDLALLDMKMAGMDGLTLYRNMKLIRPELSAILITGCSTSAIAGEAIDAGFTRILSKPPDLPQLIELISKTLEQQAV